MININKVLKSNEQKGIGYRHSHSVSKKDTTTFNFIVTNYNVCLRIMKIDNV